uniref:Uncharacterized protein n=1 Tax=Haptolina brevifila TaxID=156173 RepID=A0A7S2JIA3_9EUKA|mmetsp:Transcript_81917/g.163110  ORF Transcript_81917/g.163110 Transcript_81917/m.163110 type:complete len:485 (+) Transcript_81917:780-2234(+)
MESRRFRVSIVGATGIMPGKCPKCTVDTVVLVEPSHHKIAHVAINKLRLKVKDPNRIRLVIKSTSTELPQEGDLSDFLCNNPTLAVSLREAPGRKAHEPVKSSDEPAHQEELTIRPLDVLVVPDVLALLRLSVGATFCLATACRELRDAVMLCESGSWWEAACDLWSPLLRSLKKPSLSWRALLLEQMAAAGEAWRSENEYDLIVRVDTAPEPGLPRRCLSVTHQVPLGRSVLHQLHQRASGEDGLFVRGTSVGAPIAAAGLSAVEAAIDEADESSSNVVTLDLLRRCDGAIVPLGKQLYLAASSGLAGSPNGAKTLRLLFETETDWLEELERSQPRLKGKSRSGKKNCRADRAVQAEEERSWRTLESIEQRWAHSPCSLELHFTLPTRAKEAVLGAQQRQQQPSRGAADYAEPFFDGIRLLKLPIQDYWDIEDVPSPAWERPLLKDGGMLAELLRASGVTVLAEAWSMGGVLQRRLEARRMRW